MNKRERIINNIDSAYQKIKHSVVIEDKIHVVMEMSIGDYEQLKVQLKGCIDELKNGV